MGVPLGTLCSLDRFRTTHGFGFGMVTRTLKIAFGVYYDHLGKLLLANMFCMLMLVPILMLLYAACASGAWAFAGMLVLLLFLGVLPILNVGMAAMVKECIELQDSTLRTFSNGMRRHATQAVLLSCEYMAVLFCLSLSVWFYAMRVPQSLLWLGYALSSVAFWGVIGAVLAAFLGGPALVFKEERPWAIFRLSILLLLDNPFFCMKLAIVLLILLVLSLFPPFALFFALPAYVVLRCSAYEMLSRKYAYIETQIAQGVAAPNRRLPVEYDEQDDYLNRGLRDYLFPWKG